MKDFLETIVRIFKIPELRQRIIFTLLLLAAYRLGSFIILPGIDSAMLEAAFARQQGEGIFGFFNTFVGGAFSRGSIFALGIMPYITASIVVQLMTVAIPAVHKMQKEGETKKRKYKQKMIKKVTTTTKRKRKQKKQVKRKK